MLDVRLRKDPFLRSCPLVLPKRDKQPCWLESRSEVGRSQILLRIILLHGQSLNFQRCRQIHIHHNSDALDNLLRIYLSKYFLAQPSLLRRQSFQRQSAPNYVLVFLLLWRSQPKDQGQTFCNLPQTTAPFYFPTILFFPSKTNCQIFVSLLFTLRFSFTDRRFT